MSNNGHAEFLSAAFIKQLTEENARLIEASARYEEFYRLLRNQGEDLKFVKKAVTRLLREGGIDAEKIR